MSPGQTLVCLVLRGGQDRPTRQASIAAEQVLHVRTMRTHTQGTFIRGFRPGIIRSGNRPGIIRPFSDQKGRESSDALFLLRSGIGVFVSENHIMPAAQDRLPVNFQLHASLLLFLTIFSCKARIFLALLDRGRAAAEAC
jgi:hypothetical protein